MKPVRLLLVAALLVAAGTAAAGGSHHHNHHRHHHGHAGIGFYIGAPWRPWIAPAPLYYPYYPPQRVIVVPAQPPVYIEQPSADRYWYYCQEAGAYYPQVEECPGAWIPVPPRP